MSVPEHSMLQITGRNGTAEFNVDPKKDTFLLTMGKETKEFKRVDLWAIVFAMSDSEQQEKMMPVRQTEVVTYKRIHNVMLKKDMKKGEKVKVGCEINVEKSVVEGLKGMIEQQKAKNLPKPFSEGIPIIGMKK